MPSRCAASGRHVRSPAEHADPRLRRVTAWHPQWRNGRRFFAPFLRGALFAVAACLAAAAVHAERLTDVQRPLHRQLTQQQVRTMARACGGVLDVQIQQLKENKLESMQLYTDIVEMRKHLDLLVESEMKQVIDMLARLPSAPVAKRDQILLDAAAKSRQIVVVMLVERQNLLRRLRIAELAAQVRQLIGLQSKVLGHTKALPEQPQAKREPLTLSAIEDQRDTTAAYLRFKEALRDVAKWTGEVGVEAAEGLRLLEVHKVDSELSSAETLLRAANYADSAASQQRVIAGLQAVLTQVQKIQGAAEKTGAKAVEEAIRKLAEEQAQVRQATEESKLTEKEAEKLVAKQEEVRKEAAELAQNPETPAAAKPALQQAEEESKKAAADSVPAEEEGRSVGPAGKRGQRSEQGP